MLNVEVSDGSIRLSGRLTARFVHHGFSASPRFSEEKIVIDLAKVEKVDSAGLALLVYWSRLATKASCALDFHNAPAKLNEIAELVGVLSIVQS